MLEREFEYYLDNQDMLVEKYNNQHIVIVDKKVVGAYKDRMSAFVNSSERYEQGTFLIIHCTPGDESYTYHYRARTVATA